MTYQLTRIKNNNITDSTILANTKIVPGSIVGSLFNSNLTMTSDVTITGNLTVQGASTYLTVASTNTYVNDPLIILNNAFSGTNTYDIGLLFNRGGLTATSFIWNEDNDEFQLVYTTDDGSTYGTINNSGFAKLHVGNLVVDTASSFGSLALTGDITAGNINLTGDLLIGGRDLTANTTSFNLLNTTVTTANVLGSATTINLGATTGNLNLNNANIWMPNATSVDSGQSSVTLFATPATATVLGGATTLTIGAGATALNLGSATGTANIHNATTNILGNAVVSGTLGVTQNATFTNDIAVNGGDITTTSGSFNLVNTNATVVSFAGAASTLTIGATSGTATIRNDQLDILGNASVSGALGVTGDTTLTGDLAVNGGDLTTVAGTFNLLDTNATTVNFAGAASTVEIGATSGTLTLNNPTVVGSSTTANLWNTTATTINAFGAAAQINLGASGSSLLVRSQSVYSDQTMVWLYDLTTTTLNFAGAASTLQIGATTGTANLRNATTNIIGNATVGGTLSVTGAATLTNDLAVNGGDLTTTATTFNLLNTNATTVNFAGNATTLTVGATTGNTTVRNDLTVAKTLTARDINGTVIGNVTPASATFSQLDVSTATDTAVPFISGTQFVYDGTFNFNYAGKILTVNQLSIDGTNNQIATSTGDLNLSAFSGNIYVNAAQLKDVADPTDLQDAVTLSYLNQQISSAVTNIQSDDSDITILDDGINPGQITSHVDAVEVFNLNSSTATFYTNFVTLDSANTAVNVAGNLTVTNDLAVNGGDLTTTATTFNLVNANATTVNFARAATALYIGAGTGTATISNPTVVLPNATNVYVTQTTLSLANENATTVDAFGAATTLTLSATTGNTSIRNNLTAGGNVQINATTQSTNASTGALVVDGGVGIAKNLNVAGDTIISGNLTVEGTTTTLNTSTLDVEDLNITVAKGAASSAAANGAGLTVDGAGATLTYTHATTSWDLNKTTRITDTTDATNNTEGAVQVLGGLGVAKSVYARDINGTVIGNVTPEAGTFTNLTATQNISGSVTGSIQLQANTAFTINSTTTGTIDNFNIGATTAGTGKFTTLTSTGNTSLGLTNASAINNTPIGNATPSTGVFTTFTAQGNTSLGLTEAAAINNTPIGNATASSGAFTTLTASDIVQFTNNSEATSVGTGALRVTGGASIGANLFIGGNVNFVGSSYVLTGNYGVFYGDANGFGALYAGVTGYTVLPSTVSQFTADIDNYAQVNFQNVNTGADATSDWVATAGDGNDYNHYIDMGITTSNWDGTQDNSLTNAVGANDGYLYVQGNVTTGAGGNLTIGASTSGTKKVSVIVGGNTASSITAVFNNPDTASTNTTTGALTVAGGVGITGTLNANNINVTNTLSSTDLTLSGDLAVNGGDLTTTATTFNLINTNATTVNFANAATAIKIGASTGYILINNPSIEGTSATQDLFASSDTQTLNIGTKATSVSIGKNTGTLTLNNPTVVGSTTTANLFNTTATTINAFGAASTLNVGATTGTLTLNNPTVVGSQTTANLWNTTTTTVNAFGAATAINLGAAGSSGTLTVNNDTVVGSATTQNLFNTTATTVNFAGEATTLNIGADTGTATINNDTVNLEGNVNVNKTTASTDSTTGALVVDGGVGIAGNLNTNSLVRFTDTTASTQYDNGAVVLSGGLGVAGNINAKAGQYISVGAELTTGKLPNTLAEFISSANIGSAIAIRNMSTDSSASASFTALADNHLVGSVPRLFAFGIANSNYDEGIIVKPNDAYVFNQTGNIYVGTQTAGKNLGFVVGGNSASALVTTVTSSGVDVHSTTQATSTSTGALTVAGGVGIGGNVWVANGAVINNSQTFDNFTVKGASTTSLIHADSTYGAVVIGGSNASPQLGATLKVNSTDSLMVPVGTTADRPDNSGNVAVQGMIRFNTSTSTFEFYTGTQWQSAGSDTTWTIVSNEQFTGNGSANTYVLSRSTTTSGAVVSINGILQIPTLAYSINGSSLEFTENPADGDIIDVRIFTTTQTVGDVTSPNGLNAFTPDNTNGAAIYSGTTSGDKAIRATATPEGKWAFVNGTKTTYDQTAVNVPSASAPILIDSFVSSDYSTAKYVVQIKEGSGNVQIMEALVAHNGTNAYVNTYGVVDTNGDMGALTANIVSGNVRLYYTSSSITNSNVKVYTTYIV